MILATFALVLCQETLTSGLGKAEALHQAQLRLLRRNRAEYGDARLETWGAFVLSGDWE